MSARTKHIQLLVNFFPYQKVGTTVLRNRFLGIFVLALCSVLASKSATAGDGEALLIVFPDYPINTDSFYGYTELAGHAGVLLIGDNGLTKYYEFGRYDKEKKGRVRKPKISDVKIEDGLATPESLTVVLKEISKQSGKSGNIRAAYFINMDFAKMNSYAAKLLAKSTPKSGSYDENRKPYAIASYNCGHFAEDVILQGHPKVDQPTIVNPLPVNIVDEYIEEGNAEVLLDAKSGKLTIGTGDEADAKE